MLDTEELLNQAADHILLQCGSLCTGESALIVYDEHTEQVANLLGERCARITRNTLVRRIPAAAMHGTEPPDDVAHEMARSDVIFGLTWFSLAHTRARSQACAAGARYLSLPEYSLKLLADPAVTVDYRERAPIVRRFADAFTSGERVRVVTELGTDVQLDIRGRTGNYCPGFVERAGELGSPPDIEANVSPVEDASEGTVVVDGSIPCAEIGLLRTPLRMEIRNGSIVSFESDDPKLVATIKDVFARANSNRAYVLAECGVGLNTAAQLTGVMLTDEGAADCMHFGFGSNSTVGGRNIVSFHLDFVFRNPNLFVDGKQYLDRGTVCQ